LSGGRPGLPGWSLLVLGALGAIPASDFALGMLNYRLTRTLHAAALPALELPDKVPESLRTLVVVPTMITSADGVEEIVTRLETHFLGERQRRDLLRCGHRLGGQPDRAPEG
jgi:hypothetical protein